MVEESFNTAVPAGDDGEHARGRPVYGDQGRGSPSRPPKGGDGKKAKIVAITNQKGGVGKTTTAINLGACLALEGQRVLLVDLDPQGNATSGLGIERSRIERLYLRCVDQSGIPPRHDPSDRRGGPAHRPLHHRAGRRGDRAGVGDVPRVAPVRDACRRCSRTTTTIIFIDCPPSLGLLTINALAAADEILIPIQCEYYALEGLVAADAHHRHGARRTSTRSWPSAASS